MATRVGSAYFDITLNTTAARREMTAMVGVLNRQFGLLAGVGVVGATVAVGALTQATIGLGRAALDSANEYEVAFARVRKTLDDGTLSAEGTAAAFAVLDQSLRNIALEVPLDLSTEIAAVAALGGQMGIAREEIADFTRVIGEIGVTTTLSVDDAATQFARLANIMGTPASGFRDVGDSLVHLGNNLAATEDEILRFGLRIAAAGRLAGFTEQDVLAVAGAFSAVGIPAERGGTAVQTAIIRISDAVASGSEKLEILAQVSGVTADEFAAAWRENAAGAFVSFIEGLGTAGDDAYGILRDLQLGTVRTTQSLLSMAAAGPLLAESLALSSDATGALARESDIFFSTTQANLQLLANTAENAGIRLGRALQEPLNDIIDKIREWIELNPELIDQVGANLASALEGLGPIVLTTIDLIAKLTLAWTDFLASLNEKPEGGIGQSQMDEFQDFLQRGILADPHISIIVDFLPGNLGEGMTQLTIVEEQLRKRLRDANIARPGVAVNAFVDAFVELDRRLEPLGQKITKLGFDELMDEFELGEDQIWAVVEALRELGINLPPNSVLFPDFVDPRVFGPGGVNPGPSIPSGGIEQRKREAAAIIAEQQAIADALADAQEEAEAYAEGLDKIRTAAADAGVDLRTFLDNIDRLSPGMAEFVDQAGAGKIYNDAFAASLSNLQNAIDFDLGSVTDQFELLLEVTNKAGEEVPATVEQMVTDLRQQAQDLADLEAAVTILELLGFDDLAAKLWDEGIAAKDAAVGFVNDIPAAMAAEAIFDEGQNPAEKLLGIMEKALEDGDITPEILDLVAQFTSTQVQEAVSNAATSLYGLFGQALIDAFSQRTDIRVPVHLIPEITSQDWPDSVTGAGSDSVVPPRPRGPSRPPPAVLEMNFMSPQIPTTDAARAANLIRNMI